MKVNITSIVLTAAMVYSLRLAAQRVASTTDTAMNSRVTKVEKSISSYLPGNSHLVIVGLTTFGYSNTRTINTDINGNSNTSRVNGFGNSDTYEFSPMFLWRHDKKMLLEFEPSFSKDGVGINWAAISYFVAPNIILRGGYFVLPFGMYSKKLAAGWINKVATDPIGLPTAQDYGVGASGGFYLGEVKWNYDVSVSNGFSLQPNGQLQNIMLQTNSLNETYTARIGILPILDNSLEIGVSGLTGGVANGNTAFNKAVVNMYAFDLNYVKNIDIFQLNIKGQYNSVNVNNQTYQDTTQNKNNYSFTNNSNSGYGQVAIRPINLKNTFLKNLEFAYRYGIYNTPNNSYWASKNTQMDFGVNYWINWRTVLRVTYEIMNSTNPMNGSLNVPYNHQAAYSLHFQFSVQL